MNKKEYHHGNLKAEFLQIAFDFIKNEDIEKLTLKVLADATGTSRSAIYRHFKNKDALIETMILEGFEQFDDKISPVFKEKRRSLVDRFYISGKHYIVFAMENPSLYRLLFGKKYAHIREEIVSIKDDDCSGFGALKIAVEEGQRDGILKKESSFDRSVTIWASLHGLSSLIIDGFMHVEEQYETLYDNLFQTLLAGAVADKVKILSTIPFVKKILTPKKIEIMI